MPGDEVLSGPPTGGRLVKPKDRNRKGDAAERRKMCERDGNLKEQ